MKTDRQTDRMQGTWVQGRVYSNRHPELVCRSSQWKHHVTCHKHVSFDLSTSWLLQTSCKQHISSIKQKCLQLRHLLCALHCNQLTSCLLTRLQRRITNDRAKSCNYPTNTANLQYNSNRQDYNWQRVQF